MLESKVWSKVLGQERNSKRVTTIRLWIMRELKGKKWRVRTATDPGL